MTQRGVALAGWTLVAVGAVALIFVYVFSLVQRPAIEFALVPAVLLSVGFVLVIVARLLPRRSGGAMPAESEVAARSRFLIVVAGLVALTSGGVLVVSLARIGTSPGWALFLALGVLGLVGGAIALFTQLRKMFAG